MGRLFVFRREDLKLERRLGRLSWRGRGCCDVRGRLDVQYLVEVWEGGRGNLGVGDVGRISRIGVEVDIEDESSIQTHASRLRSKYQIVWYRRRSTVNSASDALFAHRRTQMISLHIQAWTTSAGPYIFSRDTSYATCMFYISSGHARCFPQQGRRTRRTRWYRYILLLGF